MPERNPMGRLDSTSEEESGMSGEEHGWSTVTSMLRDAGRAMIITLQLVTPGHTLCYISWNGKLGIFLLQVKLHSQKCQ